MYDVIDNILIEKSRELDFAATAAYCLGVLYLWMLWLINKNLETANNKNSGVSYFTTYLQQ